MTLEINAVECSWVLLCRHVQCPNFTQADVFWFVSLEICSADKINFRV